VVPGGGGVSPLDPTQPFPTDPAAIQVDKNADFARRLAVLERGGPPTPVTVTVGDGPPVGDAPDGRLHVDRTSIRLYVRVNSTWRYTGLT
jgi:hypothetical protein